MDLTLWWRGKDIPAFLLHDWCVEEALWSIWSPCPCPCSVQWQAIYGLVVASPIILHHWLCWIELMEVTVQWHLKSSIVYPLRLKRVFIQAILQVCVEPTFLRLPARSHISFPGSHQESFSPSLLLNTACHPGNDSCITSDCSLLHSLKHPRIKNQVFKTMYMIFPQITHPKKSNITAL